MVYAIAPDDLFVYAYPLCVGPSPRVGGGSLVSLLLQELLKSNMQQNLQLVVQVAKEYTEQLGASKIIELLENNKTYHGLYYYLGSYIAFSEDPEVHFK